MPRNTYYGIVNRDFTKTTQNIGTIDLQYHVNDVVTLENKMRQEYSILNYIGTIPENPAATVLLPPGAPGGCGGTASSTPTCLSGYTQLNAQSRFETVAVLADDPQVNFDSTPARSKNAVVFGGDFDHERISINSYTGLTSEGLGSEGLVSSTGARSSASMTRQITLTASVRPRSAATRKSTMSIPRRSICSKPPITTIG